MTKNGSAPKPVSMLAAASDLRRAVKEGADGIGVRQRQRLDELIAFARQRSLFYREKYIGLPESVDDVTRLPVVTKHELMARFDDWVTDPEINRACAEAFIADKSLVGHPFIGKYLVGTTSGTTGTPAILLYDTNMINVVGAINLARAVTAWLTAGDLWRLLSRGAKTAAIWATGGHFLGVSMATRQLVERPSRAKRLKVLPVQQPISTLVAELNAYKPAMLNGYATAIALLAEEQAAGRLNIDPVLILTSSESLPSAERTRISETFSKALVRDNYGASEFVAMAYDCGHGWMHLNADWVIVEPVDENYRPVAPGVTSRSTLVTNLANRVQPIIRYEMGDRITVSPDPCPCGSPLPAIRVDGRTDDVLRFVAPNGLLVPILPLALWSVMKETPGVLRFQAIQTSPHQLIVRLEPKHSSEREAVWRNLRDRICGFLDTQNLPNIEVILTADLPVRDPVSGKYRHIWVDSSKRPSPERSPA